MIIIASCMISKNLEELFDSNVVSLKPYEKLDIPVSSHPDMLLCVIDKNVFCYEDYYINNLDIFEKIEAFGYEVIKTKHECNKKYPQDIGLNVLVIGKKIFCNEKFTAKEVIEYAKSNGYEIINVKQGYSACSTFVVNENNVITSDHGMKKAFEKEGINVMLVSNSSIVLEGYKNGFVGGCGFLLENNAYFFGNIIHNTEYTKFYKRLESLKFNVISVKDGELYDFGGVKIL